MGSSFNRNNFYCQRSSRSTWHNNNHHQQQQHHRRRRQQHHNDESSLSIRKLARILPSLCIFLIALSNDTTFSLSFVNSMTISRRKNNNNNNINKASLGSNGVDVVGKIPPRPAVDGSVPVRKRSLSSSIVQRQTTAQDKNSNWYNKRRSGIKVPSGGKKPPQWEKEGDALYLSSSSFGRKREEDDNVLTNELVDDDAPLSYSQAHDLLSKYAEVVLDGQTDASPTIQPKLERSTRPDVVVPADNNDMPFLWGSLPVGPVWKSRLIQAGYESPTPIQVESFKVIVDGDKNAVIAAPTGSGKTLAYLLPLLTSTSSKQIKKKQQQQRQHHHASSSSSTMGKVWIVTPSMELAFQQQRMINRLIHGQEERPIDDDSSSSVLHVLCYPDSESTDEGVVPSSSSSSSSSSYPLLSHISTVVYPKSKPPILAGTPKRLAQLRKEIRTILRVKESDAASIDANLRIVASTLDNNLQTLVLDEADRLLRTDAAVPTTSASSSSSTTTTTTRSRNGGPKITKPITLELLSALLWDSSTLPHRSKLHVICASATVGRSLRRQLMHTMGAPSMDKAAVLVTADVRTKKHLSVRKSSLLPINLQHYYRLIEEESIDGNDDIGMNDGQSPVRTDESTSILRSLFNTLATLPAEPSIVFPGKVGVEKVQEFLKNEHGFHNILGLPSSSNQSLLNGRDNNNNNNDNADDDSTTTCSSTTTTTTTSDGDDDGWKNTPIYVVKERLGRGLDIPAVRYVFILGVPTNAASYTHLAGRTARHNATGRAITICSSKEAYNLASIADSLGLKLTCLNDNGGQ